MKKIMKFGGTSLGSGKHIRLAAELITRDWKKGDMIVAVASAMSTVTDSLVEAAEKARGRDQQFISEFIEGMRKKHSVAAKEAVTKAQHLEKIQSSLDLKLEELEKILSGIGYLGELTPRSRDLVLSFGEILSAHILQGSLVSMDVKAEFLTGGSAGIVTDSHYGEARPLMNVTVQQVKARLSPLLSEGVVPVVTGFIAVDQEGFTTTLGRGSSDYTATLLGNALDANEIWIWTDVDGLMTADPTFEPEAKMIQSISFAEATEMAYFGAKVMHPKALEPAAERGIPVKVKNSFNPSNPGTSIVKELYAKSKGIVKAVTLVRDSSLITVSGGGMVGAPGIAAKVFGILGEENVNVIMISQGSSEATISFMVPRKSLAKAVNALELALLGTNMVKDIASESNVCVVAAVGAGMKGTPGVAARVFQAVAKQGINVRMIAQGSSELNISFVVKEEDGEEAVKALHREFHLGS